MIVYYLKISNGAINLSYYKHFLNKFFDQGFYTETTSLWRLLCMTINKQPVVMSARISRIPDQLNHLMKERCIITNYMITKM